METEQSQESSVMQKIDKDPMEAQQVRIDALRKIDEDKVKVRQARLNAMLPIKEPRKEVIALNDGPHARERARIDEARKNIAKMIDFRAANEAGVGIIDGKAAVQAKGDVNLVRDIQWVYDNLKDLIIEPPDPGSPCVLSEYILAKAPSSGAVAMARYARDDDKAFVSRFVVKLLPRDLQPKEEISDRERLLNVDPEFETLEKYFG